MYPVINKTVVGNNFLNCKKNEKLKKIYYCNMKRLNVRGLV